MGQLSPHGEVPAPAHLAEKAALAESGQVVGDGAFGGGVEHGFDAMGGGGCAKALKVGDGDEDGVGAVGDDIALGDLEAVIGEAIDELPGLIATELVCAPANAGRLAFRDGLCRQLVNGVGDLVDVLVATCTSNPLAFAVA